MQIHTKKLKKSKAGETRVRFFNEVSLFGDVNASYATGDIVEVQIFRFGKWQHPYYGEIIVNKKTFSNIMTNFDDRKKNKNKLVVDENHEPDHKALAIFKQLEIKGNKMVAKVELTRRGAKILSDGSYHYFSPEIIFDGKDDETGKPIKDLLTGGAFTNKPYFTNMQELRKSVMASEVANHYQKHNSSAVSNQTACFFNSNLNMPKIDKIMALLSKATDGKTLTATEAEELKNMYSELADEEKSEELNDSVEEAIEDSDTSDTDPDKSDEDKEEEEDKDKEDDEESDEDEEKADSDEDSEEEEDEDEEDEEEEEEDDKDKVKASKKMVKVKASKLAKFEAMEKEFGTMQKSISKLTRQNRKNFTTIKAKKLRFSQKDSKSRLSPASAKALVHFALGLSREQAKNLFTFLEGMKVIDMNQYGASTQKNNNGVKSMYLAMAKKQDPNDSPEDQAETAKFMQEEAEKTDRSNN